MTDQIDKLLELTRPGPRKLLCLEVNPPRGVNLQPVFDRLDGQLEDVDFLNVTDCALARMKLAALPFAAVLKHRYGKEALVNLSCRDRNLIALQADLLAGWVSGIRSVVALTGDAVTIGDSPDRKGVFEVNSIGLLNAVRTLNSGVDLAGNSLTGAPSFLPGVVVNPNVKNPAAEIKRLKRKADAGGLYALSQPVFNQELAVNFCRDAAGTGIQLMLGFLPFKSLESARAMNKIPGIKMPEELLSTLEGLPESEVIEGSIRHCLQIAEAAGPYVRGFHVISGATPKLGLTLVRRLAEFIKAR